MRNSASPASLNAKNSDHKMAQYKPVWSSFTWFTDSSSLHGFGFISAFAQSPNSASSAKRTPYVREHRYCAHRSQTGMRSVRTKKPAKRSWGTNKRGKNSVAIFGSSTAQPSKTATAVLDMAKPYSMARKWKNADCNPTIKYEMRSLGTSRRGIVWIVSCYYTTRGQRYVWHMNKWLLTNTNICKKVISASIARRDMK